ncbi:uncharacterized protein V1516DRAFT_677506 [Lipomyces oligophaga]|uniref:uncharacterized protein n=1 Tax=Lipomyces oligophaga TaxID=45792 RepID=UPI0034CF516B
MLSVGLDCSEDRTCRLQDCLIRTTVSQCSDSASTATTKESLDIKARISTHCLSTGNLANKDSIEDEDQIVSSIVEVFLPVETDDRECRSTSSTRDEKLRDSVPDSTAEFERFRSISAYSAVDKSQGSEGHNSLHQESDTNLLQWSQEQPERLHNLGQPKSPATLFIRHRSGAKRNKFSTDFEDIPGDRSQIPSRFEGHFRRGGWTGLLQNSLDERADNFFTGSRSIDGCECSAVDELLAASELNLDAQMIAPSGSEYLVLDNSESDSELSGEHDSSDELFASGLHLDQDNGDDYFQDFGSLLSGYQDISRRSSSSSSSSTGHMNGQIDYEILPVNENTEGYQMVTVKGSLDLPLAMIHSFNNEAISESEISLGRQAKLVHNYSYNPSPSIEAIMSVE